MPISLEDEWTVIAGGLIAHADEIMDRGEWDTVLRYLGRCFEASERSTWHEILVDQDALEKRYAELPDPPAEFREELLRRAWKVALADGVGSDIEESVHDRIALRLEIDLDEVATMREKWTAQAETQAYVTIALAAMFVNLDGRLDFHEAVHFDDLLGRSPVPMSRRIELAAMLNDPPSLDEVVGRLTELPMSDRLEALGELVPLVQASPRPERERAEFIDVSNRVGVNGKEAEELLSVASAR